MTFLLGIFRIFNKYHQVEEKIKLKLKTQQLSNIYQKLDKSSFEYHKILKDIGAISMSSTSNNKITFSAAVNVEI